jgi:hypothetical protein
MANNSKGNDESNQKFGPVSHTKASDAINEELARLKRDPNHVQKLAPKPSYGRANRKA